MNTYIERHSPLFCFPKNDHHAIWCVHAKYKSIRQRQMYVKDCDYFAGLAEEGVVGTPLVDDVSD